MQNKTLVAIDFETANNRRNSACAAALVRVENGKIVAEEYTLIRPPDMYFQFTHVHGITEEDVYDAPAFAKAWESVSYMTKGADYFIAHNAPFDKSVLQACCESEGMTMPAVPFLCTLQIVRKLWGFNPANLAAVCENLKIPLNHHHALSDAKACAQIMIAAMEKKKIIVAT